MQVTHGLVNTDIYSCNRGFKKKVLKKRWCWEGEELSWNARKKTGGPEDDGEESELVKVKKQMKKIQQKQSKMKPTRQIPRVREEANRQRGKRAIEEEIYSWLLLWALLSEPNDKTSCFDVSGGAFAQRTSAVTQHPALLKQGQEETNRGKERPK